MPGFTEYQPQAPNAPFDRNATERFFEGMDLWDFDTLGHRIIPCRMMQSHAASDSAGRFWTWNPAVDRQCWSLVPSELDCLRIALDFEQWKLVAHPAVTAVREIAETAAGHHRIAALRRLSALQEALFAIWTTSFTHLGDAWLYLTVTETGRWALPRLEIPAFCPAAFNALLKASWDQPLPEQHLAVLRRDPVIRSLPAVGAPIFPKQTGLSGRMRGRLMVIEGDRR